VSTLRNPRVLLGAATFMHRALVGSLLVVLVALVFCALWTPTPALAQGALLRNQARIMNRAVQEQVRQALHPTFAIRRDSAGAVTALSVAADRYLVVALADNRVRIWDLQTGAQRWVGAPAPAAISAAAVDGQLNILAELLADGSVRLTELASEGQPARIFAPSNGVPLTALAVRTDGSGFVAGDARGGIVHVGRADLQVLGQVPASGVAITALSAQSDGTVLYAGRADGTVIRARVGRNGALNTLPVVRVATAAVRALTVDGSGAAVLDASGTVSLRSLADNFAETGRAAVGDAGAGMAMSADRLYVTGGGKVHVLARPNGAILAEQPLQTDAPRLAATSGGVFVGDSRSIMRLLSPSGLERAKLVSTRWSWVVLDTQGRFDGDERAFRDAVWATDDGDVSVDAFSTRYYAPGVLVRALDPSYGGTPVSAAPAPIEDGIYLPPVVRIEQVQVPTRGGAALQAVLVVEDGLEAGFSAVRVFNNGKIVANYPADSFEKSKAGAQLWRWQRSILVTGAPGDNSLDVVAIGWNGVSSAPVAVSWRDATPLPPQRLLISSFGVNNYLNDRWNLNFAVADASAVAEVFQGQARRSYDGVAMQILTDNDATRPAITHSLQGLETATPDDVLILFLAGHGKAIDGEWYFLPQHKLGDLNDDAAIKRNGLSSAQLADYLARSPVQQIVLLIDACNSGAAIDAFDDFDARRQLRQLSRQTGVHILTATRADELAPEYAVLGHGVFTRVLIAAFEPNRQGGLNGDVNGDGEITVQELGAFLATTVPRLIMQLDQLLQNSAGVQRGDFSKRTLVSPANHGFGSDFTLVRTR
jgi:hypothetical protein